MKLTRILLLLFCIYSCVDYAPLAITKKAEEKIILQDFYSPCCGSCGQRIVIDNYNGLLSTLQVNCKIENQYSHLCTPMQLGTHKKVLYYKKNKIIAEKYYKPIYDTIELKRIYPKANRGEYYYSLAYTKELVLLTKSDSVLFDNYYSMSTKKQCSDKHLKFIKGFVLINEVIEKQTFEKKKDFNKKVKKK